jgi:hypothetical protein
MMYGHHSLSFFNIPPRGWLRYLLVGVVCALLGYCLAGCDGSGDWQDPDAGDEVPGNLRRDDAGRLSCDVPSPTGDQPSGYGTARDLPPNNFVLVANDVEELCESWKAAYSELYAARPSSDLPTPDLVAGVDCSDPAHDFRGTTGVPWSVWATDLDGTPCSANASSGTCEAVGLLPMPLYSSSDPAKRLRVRSWALCSTAGRFSGWLYTTS